MSSNDDVVRDVKDQLARDHDLDAKAIAVSAAAGRVTLRGTVGSLRAKHAATKAAERGWGVVSVANELDVRLLDDQKRDDAALRGEILQALMGSSSVPATVDVQVRGGFVALTGTADWQYECDDAEQVAAGVYGSLGIVDEIAVKHPGAPDAESIEGAILRSFVENARLDARNLHVSTSNGTVTVEGDVQSWAEHDEAIAAAWSAPGVTAVRDRIRFGSVGGGTTIEAELPLADVRAGGGELVSHP